MSKHWFRNQFPFIHRNPKIILIGWWTFWFELCNRTIFFTSIFDWFIEWQVKNNLFRYSNPLERMFSGSHPRSQETEEGPVGRTDRSVPSANSQKILWDGLTDFERIKRKEIQVSIKLIFNSFRIHTSSPLVKTQQCGRKGMENPKISHL